MFDNRLNIFAFVFLFGTVVVTAAVGVFLAEEEQRVNDNYGYIIVAFYGLFVISVEFYRAWAHTARVKLVMEAAHNLQLQILNHFTASKHHELVRGVRRVRDARVEEGALRSAGSEGDRGPVGGDGLPVRLGIAAHHVHRPGQDHGAHACRVASRARPSPRAPPHADEPAGGAATAACAPRQPAAA